MMFYNDLLPLKRESRHHLLRLAIDVLQCRCSTISFVCLCVSWYLSLVVVVFLVFAFSCLALQLSFVCVLSLSCVAVMTNVTLLSRKVLPRSHSLHWLFCNLSGQRSWRDRVHVHCTVLRAVLAFPMMPY
jgi:hypothetical protein